MSNLEKRLLTGATLIIIISLFTALSWISFTVLVLTIDLLALQEFYGLTRGFNLSPRILEGITVSGIMIVTLILFLTKICYWKILLLNVPFLMAIFISELFLHSATPVQNIAFTLLGIICVSLPLCFFIMLAFLPLHLGSYHREIILGYFFILWAGDSGAFLIGKNVGKRPLFRRISPSKTWEGSIGGFCCALLVACITSSFFAILSTLQWLTMAILISLSGTFGDLAKSLLKRSLHIKDSGNILPGHGGMLDRFDSLLGSAPLVFCYLVAFVHT